jgi:hypothetical protein
MNSTELKLRRDGPRFELGIYWDGGGNGAVPAAAAGSGPLPHSRYIGASPMAIDLNTFDVWYYTNVSDTAYAVDADDFTAGGYDAWAAAAASTGGYHLHPSSRLWAGRDSGTILDDDGVGNMVPSPAAEWCSEAVQPGNLEVWASPLSGHRLAVSLLNRSPTAQNITVRPEPLSALRVSHTKYFLYGGLVGAQGA